MSEQPKLALAIIDRNVEGEIIEQRITDGYINATHLCKAAGKEFKHYLENKSTKDFLNALSFEVGIPTSNLVQVISGGNSKL